MHSSSSSSSSSFFFFFFFFFFFCQIVTDGCLIATISSFLSFFFLLDIFFIYISSAILKVPYTHPSPCSPTYLLPLPGPGIPLYWGI
jgi:hypothetical protein